MGCIEIDFPVICLPPPFQINRNMGCIEMADAYFIMNRATRINRNMGCIEIKVVLAFWRVEYR